MKKKKYLKHSIRSAIGSALELPSDAYAANTVELIGRWELVLSGCSGILVYDSDRIVLSSGIGEMTVRGEKLVLLTMAEGSVRIRGQISSFALED